MPPTTTVETFASRKPLEATRADLTIKVPVTAASGHAIGRGNVIGVITASGKVRRRTKTTVDTTPFATNSTTGKVTDATLFKDGDVLQNSAGVTIGTIAASGINLTTRVITLTGNAAVAVADGAGVYGSDGSQVSTGFADEGSDGVGDTVINAIIGGVLKAALLGGLDATAKSELSGFSAPGGIFKF